MPRPGSPVGRTLVRGARIGRGLGRRAALGVAVVAALTGCGSDGGGPPPFTDVTRTWGPFHTTPSYKGGGVCMIDHDLDGDLDLYFTTDERGPNRLYRNDREHFTDVTGESGTGVRDASSGCLALDYDGDGDADLYVTTYGADRLLRNDGGRFSDVTDEAGIATEGVGTSASSGDIDGDGDLDLAVGRSGETKFGGPGEKRRLRNLLFLNQGDGTFSEEGLERGLVEEEPTFVVRLVDIDEDGDADLYVGNDIGALYPSRVYVNDGAGRFVDRGEEFGLATSEYLGGQAPSNMGMDIGDYDLDGTFDVVATNVGRLSVDLWDCERGPDGPRCRDVAPEVGLDADAYVNWAVGLVDFDHDGDLDLFTVAGMIPQFTGDERSQIYWNQGGRFAREPPRAGDALDRADTSRGAAFGDLDEDGDMDVAIANLDGGPQILRNDAEAGHWIRLQLVGTRSNIEGIGARVTVTAGGRRLTEHRLGGGSFLSNDDPRMHFGLGQHREADVDVVWPSGIVECWEDLAADQPWVLREEASPVEE